MNALEIHGLTKKRGEFVLQGLELTLPAGCIMGLIGENGLRYKLKKLSSTSLR